MPAAILDWLWELHQSGKKTHVQWLIKHFQNAPAHSRIPASAKKLTEAAVTTFVDRLRKWLNEFFDGDGAHLPIRITIAKGTYNLVFVSNDKKATPLMTFWRPFRENEKPTQVILPEREPPPRSWSTAGEEDSIGRHPGSVGDAEPSIRFEYFKHFEHCEHEDLLQDLRRTLNDCFAYSAFEYSLHGLSMRGGGLDFLTCSRSKAAGDLEANKIFVGCDLPADKLPLPYYIPFRLEPTTIVRNGPKGSTRAYLSVINRSGKDYSIKCFGLLSYNLHHFTCRVPSRGNQLGVIGHAFAPDAILRFLFDNNQLAKLCTKLSVGPYDPIPPFQALFEVTGTLKRKTLNQEILKRKNPFRKILKPKTGFLIDAPKIKLVSALKITNCIAAGWKSPAP